MTASPGTMARMGRPRTARVAHPPASRRVRDEWLRRVSAEYRSATIAHHLTLWLMQLGASPDLIRAGLRIAGDEITHAEMSHRVFRAARGEGGPRLERETLGLPRREGEPLEHDVVRAGTEVFCLGETVAVPLFKELRSACTVVPARRVLDRVLRDEVRHRDFGWALLAWMLEQTGGDVLRALVARELPAYFARARASYASPGAEHLTAIDEADRAWGLMPPAEYARVLEATLERDWVPRFGRLGIDARAAWG
jgi:hypothetical protein